MIKAITFDFWDTIALDDSDEKNREKLNLPPKPVARAKLLIEEIQNHHPEIPAEKIEKAFFHANERFNHFWKKESITPTVSERIGFAYEYLKINNTPGFNELVHQIENMEVNVPPDIAPGISDALKELKKTYALGIISDTIHTSGEGLRTILRNWDLFDCFSSFVFSDELGASKPSRKVFEKASEELGASFNEMAHVGDRESNDVLGPLELGMKAVFYTGAIDRGSDKTKASIICKDHTNLVECIAQLSNHPAE